MTPMASDGQQVVMIDARAASANGEPVRVIATTLVSDGKVLVGRTDNYYDPIKAQDNVVVVTDTPNIHRHWSLCFDEKSNMKELLKAYRLAKNSRLLHLSDGVRQYDPSDILQAAKMDERGQVYEFDTDITNGHMAVLLAVWAASLAYAGNIVSNIHDDGTCHDNDGTSFMPFTVI